MSLLQNNAQSKMSAREYELIQELVKTKLEQGAELEYESLDDYELPPPTQFSMLKKPAVSIKYGKMTFNMACIRMFEGVRHILPIVNAKSNRLAVIPCAEEESATVEWARIRKKDNAWTNKTISSVDFLEKIFSMMGWDLSSRYKVLGRVAMSNRGLILVFELEEAIQFDPVKEEYFDEKTGKVKRRDVKYYPEKYKNRIGISYNDYEAARQLNQFEDVVNYNDETESDGLGFDASETILPNETSGIDKMLDERTESETMDESMQVPERKAEYAYPSVVDENGQMTVGLSTVLNEVSAV